MFGGGEITAYATAKAAVVGLTRALARAFGADNIRVNAIAPGRGDDRDASAASGTPTKTVDAMVGRQVDPAALLLGEEIARAALFLAADDSRMITKQSSSSMRASADGARRTRHAPSASTPTA